jgi:DNA-binding NtrC family response regulator
MLQDPRYMPSVLVYIEQQQAVLAVLHRLLRDTTMGYDIITVNCGTTALDLIASGRVELAIISVQADNEIHNLIDEFRQRSPHCPILLLSQNTPTHHSADYQLNIPFSFSHFGQVVQQALTLKKPRPFA